MLVVAECTASALQRGLAAYPGGPEGAEGTCDRSSFASCVVCVFRRASVQCDGDANGGGGVLCYRRLPLPVAQDDSRDGAPWHALVRSLLESFFCPTQTLIAFAHLEAEIDLGFEALSDE